MKQEQKSSKFLQVMIPFLLMVVFINCGAGWNDYEFDLLNDYKFLKWKGGGWGSEIRHSIDGRVVAHVSAINTYDYLIVGYSEVPVRYYPKTEYAKKYFIIDTLTRGGERNLSKAEWLKLLNRYGIDKEPKLTRPTRLWKFFWNIQAKDKKITAPNDFHIETKLAVTYPIDINSANIWELNKLYGVRDNTVDRICYEREKNGPFTSLKDVARRVKGIDSKTIEQWRGKVICSPPP